MKQFLLFCLVISKASDYIKGLFVIDQLVEEKVNDMPVQNLNTHFGITHITMTIIRLVVTG